MSGINRLTQTFASKVSNPGIYPDGGGLNLQVTLGKRGIGKSWIFRYSTSSKPRAMGLGRYPAVSLQDARRKRDAARALVQSGVDPRAERVPPPRRPSFGECANEYILTHEKSWKNAKNRYQWRQTLETYAAPLRAVPIDEVTTAAVLEALQPIWLTKPETASRLRVRIEAVLDAAKAHGFRSGENPAAWKGNLKHLLPAIASIHKTVHHAALPYPEIPEFMADLRQRQGISAQALAFTILTASRTGETIGATWDEVDLDAGVWTVPASRMKEGREHRVPLSNEAIAVLVAMREARFAHRVFPISKMAMKMLLRRMKRPVTVHGFRSTFRDWAGDATGFQREVAEAALAHAVGDRSEQAYRRSDALEKRRALMAAWGTFCSNTPHQSNVVALHRA